MIDKWLTVGVVEDGKWTECDEGSPQGHRLRRCSRNVYLHYVLDLWVEWWRRQPGRGEVIIVRWADDFIVGFETEQDAQAFLVELRERFARFGLELHPDKTRLIEFGRNADWTRRRRGAGRPETFHFLGFTHICARTRKGWFTVKRITIAKRMRAKLKPGQHRAEATSTSSRAGARGVATQRGARTPVYYAVPGNTDTPARNSGPKRPGTGTRRCGAAARRPG